MQDRPQFSGKDIVSYLLCHVSFRLVINTKFTVFTDALFICITKNNTFVNVKEDKVGALGGC